MTTSSAAPKRSVRKQESGATNAATTIVPFLRWPGGKRWFIQRHADVLPRNFRRYIEPFLGSGSVFFFLRPAKALLADTNEELITAFRGVRDHWPEVQRLLAAHQRCHGKRYYYRVRAQRPRALAARAARTIYLNRTCFNGIYRVNLDGEFNVPKGTKTAVVLPSDDFQAAARALSGVSLRATDFERTIDQAGSGDLVFADPPYTVRHNLNGFIKYNETLFSWEDQVRLAQALQRAHVRGAHIVSTNANHRSVRDLYSGNGFRLRTVTRFSPISAESASRCQFDELLILGR